MRAKLSRPLASFALDLLLAVFCWLLVATPAHGRNTEPFLELKLDSLLQSASLSAIVASDQPRTSAQVNEPSDFNSAVAPVANLLPPTDASIAANDSEPALLDEAPSACKSFCGLKLAFTALLELPRAIAVKVGLLANAEGAGQPAHQAHAPEQTWRHVAGSVRSRKETEAEEAPFFERVAAGAVRWYPTVSSLIKLATNSDNEDSREMRVRVYASERASLDFGLREQGRGLGVVLGVSLPLR